MTDDEFYQVAKDWITSSKVGESFDNRVIAQLLRTRVEVLNEIPDKINFLAEFGEYDSELFFHKKSKTDKEVAIKLLPSLIECVSGLESFDHDTIYNALAELATRLEIKAASLFWVFRIALTGQAVTPGGAVEMAQILGKAVSLERLNFSLNMLTK